MLAFSRGYWQVLSELALADANNIHGLRFSKNRMNTSKSCQNGRYAIVSFCYGESQVCSEYNIFDVCFCTLSS